MSTCRYLKVSCNGLVVISIVVLCCYYSSQNRNEDAPGPRPYGHRLNRELGLTAAKERSTVSAATEVNKMPNTVFSYQNTSIRFGIDLKLNLDHCPSDSYMLNRKQDFIPEHQDCPSLFIVGARKGGTTSLIQYMSKHPDFEGVRLDKRPQAGETFYFGAHYKSKTWEKYISMFPRGGVMTGESSVENLVHSAAPRRIYRACGKQAKIVMLFRDPIKRMVSNLLMRVRLHMGSMRSQTPIGPVATKHLEAFFKAIPRDSVNVTNEWSKLVGLFRPARNMLYEGLYYVHLMNWLCNFPAENIMIIRSEDFFTDPSKILDSTVRFLNLKQLDWETYDKITSVSYNSGKDVPDFQKLTQSEVTSLTEAFRPFNKALFELLHWNTSQWLGY